MNIGEKIKNLRTSKLMTQKELAGEEITRNMLSQIENGSASPSLQTLRYLAVRLGVPVGYLVSDGEENEIFYRKYANYPNLIKSFKSGEWEICRDLCFQCMSGGGEDSEIAYMLSYSDMNIGISRFNEGKLRAAYKIFEEAIEYSAMSVFNREGLLSCISSYSSIMSTVSPTLSLEMPSGVPGQIICMSDLCRYERAILRIGEGVSFSEDEGWNNEAFRHAIGAKMLMNKKNYKAAIALFSHVLEDDTLPKPVIYLILDDYEKCCKETDDYKDAYEISQAKLQLFERMLADI